MTIRERWGKDETDLFFKALRHFGTDFTLIAQLFPKRDRKHIKNKYNKGARALRYIKYKQVGLIPPNLLLPNVELRADAKKVNDALEGRGKNAAETKQLFEVMKQNIQQQQQQSAAGIHHDEPLDEAS